MPAVTLQPIGKRIQVDPGTSLLEVARLAGVELVSLCGGIGSCDSCKIRLVSGELTRLTLEEQALFSPEEQAAGYRLACQTSPLNDVIIDVPGESLTTLQRLQIEGQASAVEPVPVLAWLDVEVQAANLHDLRADTARLLDAAVRAGWCTDDGTPLVFSPAVLGTLSDRLREQNWSGRLVRRGCEIIAFLPPATEVLGIAIDIGTTKLAAYLLDLETGNTLGSVGEMNHQIAFGEDVLSRISYANQKADGRLVLQGRLVGSLNKMAEELAELAGASKEQILEVVAVGNTCMHHLAAGLPVRQLGESPYVAAVSEPLSVPAERIGLSIAPAAHIYLPPNIAGFVGADHVAMLLASETVQRAENGEAGYPVIALDIGTNTEISLVVPHSDPDGVRVLSCSAASGPAFEGGHIRAGMRAAPGAIERVQIDAEGIRLHTIGDQPPVGICGSGILDAVAQMLDNGILDRKGRIHPGHPRVRFTLESKSRGELVLVPAELAGHGSDILITREDVHEIQLAKAAIRAGIEVLLEQASLSAADLSGAPGISFIVAGAFGTYVHLPSAIRIGMFPDLPLDRFAQIGNAAGMGARQILLSGKRRRAAERIADRIEYIELANHAGFNRLFVDALFFDQSNKKMEL
jgi:uncharacterized 2Fe-2S/4Fe-4S cluster protein (DUF4445 family)